MTTEEVVKKIETIAREAMSAISQMFMAPGEMHKVDMHGTRNVGWSRTWWMGEDALNRFLESYKK